MDIATDPRLAPGANNPPEPTIGEIMAERHADLVKRAEALLAEAAGAPAEIKDDDTQGTATEMVKSLRKLELALEAVKTKEVEPYQDSVDRVRGFFKEITTRLEKVRIPLKTKTDEYTAQKIQQEKARLAKEEAERREKAAIALRNAEAAESDKAALAREASEAERLAADARAAKESAQTEQEKASASLTEAKANHGRAKTAVLELVAERSRKIRDAIEVDEEAFKTAKQLAEAKVAEARKAVDVADRELQGARERARAAKAEQERAAAQEAAARRQVREATAQVDEHLDTAVRHTRVADKIEAKIEGKPGELGRTYSEHGAMATMAREWKYEVTDADALDPVKLWPFIDAESKRIAFRKWAMLQEPANRNTMKGGRAFEENVGQIR